MRSIAYFRLQAAHCRQLASSLGNQTDPAVVGLLRMADEFDANADALEAHVATGDERMIAQ
ncbi:hypothetical protein AX289_25560 [Methylorubrum populi]|nr:hypothetical protein AX289_25560 [Methylorubrum populi]